MASSDSAWVKFRFAYDLKNPSASLEMPKKLDEISGLSAPFEQRFLYAVQDEDGIIFTLNKATGKIVDEVPFHDKGDYEGIEIVGNDAYIVKSSGTVYEVKNFGTGRQETVKYNYFLNKENNVEGLGYDSQNNRLLLSCKGTGTADVTRNPQKHIYAFNLENKQLDPQPVYIIDLEEMKKYLVAAKSKEELAKFANLFDDNMAEDFFSPSALAIHPQRRDIYISSSVGKMLMVLNPNGKIVYVEKLKKKIHPQPEGMAFDKDGTLYIASEGKDGKGVIHRFEVKKGS